MKIVHVAAECYPFAKVGGLADVVGALPKYQNLLNNDAFVVLPMYRKPFLFQHDWDVVHKSSTNMHDWFFEYTVIQLRDSTLGYELFLIDINGLLDRENVYSYNDDTERFVAFQIAFCHWLLAWQSNPDIVHCHDHHVGLIPFIMQHCLGFRALHNIPTVLTIHNAQYQGNFSWDKSVLIPQWDPFKTGLLDWNNAINSLACGIKCARLVTTVSESYLNEICYQANGLEALLRNERSKCVGIINGIDNDIWNPETDKYLSAHYNASNVNTDKFKLKEMLCEQFNIDPTLPLFIFIGRFVHEKAADILSETIFRVQANHPNALNFFILGSGLEHIENQIREVSAYFPNNVKNWIGYDEKMGRMAYAAADFLLMPSRVEPCGLNQLYSLRYGTIPIVRAVGGLNDTIQDIGDDGFGFRFNHSTPEDLLFGIERAADLYYNNTNRFHHLRHFIMTIDHSWESVVNVYQHLYSKIK